MPKHAVILHAAREVFGKHGYSATTMKMIAERAGVGFGLLAHYFGNKENLFLTAGFSLVDDLLSRLHAEVAGSRTGLEAVERFVAGYLAYTLEHRSTFAILVRCSPFSDVELPAERERIAKKFLTIITALQEHVERGVADGSIIRVDPRRTAFLVYGNILGAVRTTLVTPYEVPGLYEEAVEYVLRSLRPPPTA